MHVAIMVILIAPVGRDLCRTIVHLFDVTYVATLQQPFLPLAGRAGAAFVQLRAPLTIEFRHFRQTVQAVVEI